MQNRGMVDFAPPLPSPSTSKILQSFAYELTDQMSNYQLFKEFFESRVHGNRLRGQAWREVIGLSLICQVDYLLQS